MFARLTSISLLLGILWEMTIPQESFGIPQITSDWNRHGTSPERVGEEKRQCSLIYPIDDKPSEDDLDDLNCPTGSTKEYLPYAGAAAKGITCRDNDDPNRSITVPIFKPSYAFRPKRLTLTVNSNDSVVIEFENSPTNFRSPNVWMFLNNWSNSQQAFISDGKLILSYDQSRESRLYTLWLDISGSRTQHIVTVIRKNCPKGRFGTSCERICHTCLYGGVCDSGNGNCICPPGRKGPLCEEVSEDDVINNQCQDELPEGGGFQICLPPPLGCSCPPGYQGLRCETKCDGSHWGVDCLQICPSCSSGKCDSVTGECKDDDEVPITPKISARKEAGGLVFSWTELPKARLGTLSYQYEYETIYHACGGNRTDRTWRTPMLLQVALPAPPPFTTLEFKLHVSNGAERSSVSSKNYTEPPTVPYNKVTYLECPEGTKTCSAFLEKNCTKFNGYGMTLIAKLEYTDQRLTSRTHYQEPSDPVVNCTETTFFICNIILPDNLHPRTNYKLTVYPANNQGKNETNLKYINFTTLPPVPVAPEIFFHRGSDGLITFSWTKLQETVFGTVTYEYGYKIFKRVNLCGVYSHPWTRIPINHTEVTFRPLPPDTILDFKLRVTNAAGSRVSSKNYTKPPTIPYIKVTSLICPGGRNKICSASLENDCTKINGDGLTINAELECTDQNIISNPSYQKPGSPTGKCFLPHSFQCTINLPNNLYYNTNYRLTVYPANNLGINKTNFNSTNFKTASTVPLVPRNLTVSGAQDSLMVTWLSPAVFPPRGDVERYKVLWYKEGSRGRWPPKNFTTAAQYNIMGLETNVTYVVEVSAKNRGVSTYGDPATKRAFTKPGKPSVPCNITYNSTQEETSVEWKECNDDPKILRELRYIFSFSGKQFNVTNKSQKFSDLQPDSSYNMSLKACTKFVCSDFEKVTLYTQPSPPQVIDSDFGVVATSGNYSTIRLPEVNNYPAWQYVVVMEKNDTLEAETVKEMIKDFVKRYVETQRQSEESEPESRLGKRSAADSPDNNQYDASKGMWIAGKFPVGENSSKEFSIGNGQGNNRPLETGAHYVVSVVTERRSGKFSTFVATEPIDLKDPSKTAPFMLLGILMGVFVFLLLGLLLARNHLKSLPVFVVRVPMQNAEPEHVPDAPFPADNSALVASPARELQPSSLLSFRARPLPSPPPPPEIPLEPLLAPSCETLPSEQIYANTSRKIPFSNIEPYLSKALNTKELDVEFDSVPGVMEKSVSHGKHPENISKNRYKDILPYNDTRVKLPFLQNEPYSDYINANYIQGHRHPNAYIAAQAPKISGSEDTIDDFWRMLWHTESELVIMLANPTENGREKVAEYWPTDKPIQRGGLRISLEHMNVQMDYISRTLMMAKGDIQRQMRHYHYTSWPDHGVPQNPLGLAHMLTAIRKIPQIKPIVVHCSAGIGRTGTILLVTSVLDQIDRSGYMDAHEALHNLREGRARLLENKEQYVFAHRLLLEILCGNKTTYSCREFFEALPKLREPKGQMEMSTIQEEFHKIKTMPKDLTYKYASKPTFAYLNRNRKILPADSRLLFLDMLDGREESQYINASWVRSIDEKNAYIVSEHPMGHTLSKIWQLIYEQKLKVWTLIHSFPEDHHQDYPPVITGSQEMLIERFFVKVTRSQEFGSFTEHQVLVKPASSKRRNEPPHKCMVIQMKGWPFWKDTPDSLECVLKTMERAEFYSTAFGRPLYTCKDGVTGCGLMMALLNVTGKIRLHQEVNVYQSVLAVTYDRPQFVVSEEQYDMVHDGAAMYISSFGDYGNFQ